MDDVATTPGGELITVRGAVPAAQMGITLPHEHLLIRHTVPDVVLDDLDLVATELSSLARAGGRTVVEVTSVGIGRDPRGLRQLSERTDLHVVMGSGYYKFRWHPTGVARMSVEDIEEEIVRDITVGVADTGIRAGVIGEVGVSEFLEDNEEKSLVASARAQLRTGAAINLHVHLTDKREEEALRMRVLDIVEGQGVDLGRVIVSHCEGDGEPAYHERLAHRGVCLEYDLFGTEALGGLPVPSYRTEARLLRRLVDRGLLDQLLISHDICHGRQLERHGGWGYAHILTDAAPRLLAQGIAPSELRAIMVDNPRRVFPLRVGHAQRAQT